MQYSFTNLRWKDELCWQKFKFSALLERYWWTWYTFQDTCYGMSDFEIPWGATSAMQFRITGPARIVIAPFYGKLRWADLNHDTCSLLFSLAHSHPSSVFMRCSQDLILWGFVTASNTKTAEHRWGYLRPFGQCSEVWGWYAWCDQDKFQCEVQTCMQTNKNKNQDSGGLIRVQINCWSERPVCRGVG